MGHIDMKNRDRLTMGWVTLRRIVSRMPCQALSTAVPNAWLARRQPVEFVWFDSKPYSNDN